MFSVHGTRRSQRTVLLLTVQSILTLTLLSMVPQSATVHVGDDSDNVSTDCTNKSKEGFPMKPSIATPWHH
jgi:hypothetical protein